MTRPAVIPTAAAPTGAPPTTRGQTRPEAAPKPEPERGAHMAATLHWFLLDLVARGIPLDRAEAMLREGIRTQARALRQAGLV